MLEQAGNGRTVPSQREPEQNNWPGRAQPSRSSAEDDSMSSACPMLASTRNCGQPTDDLNRISRMNIRKNDIPDGAIGVYRSGQWHVLDDQQILNVAEAAADRLSAVHDPDRLPEPDVELDAS